MTKDNQGKQPPMVSTPSASAAIIKTTEQSSDDESVSAEEVEECKVQFEQLLGMSMDEFIRKKTEELESAKDATSKRTVDPLKDWIRPSREDCPICLLELPLSEKEAMYRTCCDKRICKGCFFDHIICLIKSRVSDDKAKEIIHRCPLCRGPPTHGTFEDKMILAKAGRLEAMFEMGMVYWLGEGVVKDTDVALEWMKRASEGGYGKAHYHLADCYSLGEAVDRDTEQALIHYQAAASQGCVKAFVDIGKVLKKMNGKIEEYLLNFRKAAMCGVCDDELFTELRDAFSDGLITKDEYAFTLRENQKVSVEMKSDSRTRAITQMM